MNLTVLEKAELIRILQTAIKVSERRKILIAAEGPRYGETEQSIEARLTIQDRLLSKAFEL